MSEEKVVWVVVHCGAKTFLGALPWNVGFYSNVTESAKQVILEKVTAGELLKLDFVVELFSPLQQVRQQTPDGERVGVARTPIATPYEFTASPFPLYVKADAIGFFDDMEDGDRRIYEGFVKTVDITRTTERAARSGLSVAKNIPRG